MDDQEPSVSYGITDQTTDEIEDSLENHSPVLEDNNHMISGIGTSSSEAEEKVCAEPKTSSYVISRLADYLMGCHTCTS